MDQLEARNMGFGTLVSRSKYYKNSKVVSLVKDLTAGGVIDEFYDKHFTPGVIRRTDYISSFFHTQFRDHKNTSVLAIGCGFNTYFEDIPHSVNAKWVNTDLYPVTTIRYTHWNESYDPHLNYHLNAVDLNDENAMPYLRAMSNKVDVLLAEGVLMYLPKAKAKEILDLPWKNVVFDVLGANRKAPLGKNHLWTYKENEWDLNIIDRKNFDDTIKDSWIYTVKRK